MSENFKDSELSEAGEGLKCSLVEFVKNNPEEAVHVMMVGFAHLLVNLKSSKVEVAVKCPDFNDRDVLYGIITTDSSLYVPLQMFNKGHTSLMG